jgi:hypothetical protein
MLTQTSPDQPSGFYANSVCFSNREVPYGTKSYTDSIALHVLCFAAHCLGEQVSQRWDCSESATAWHNYTCTDEAVLHSKVIFTYTDFQR